MVQPSAQDSFWECLPDYLAKVWENTKQNKNQLLWKPDSKQAVFTIFCVDKKKWFVAGQNKR
jgi:hypothetical protein